MYYLVPNWCENQCWAALLLIPAHFELESTFSVHHTLIVGTLTEYRIYFLDQMFKFNATVLKIGEVRFQLSCVNGFVGECTIV